MRLLPMDYRLTGMQSRLSFTDLNARIQNPHVRLKDFETKPNNNILERLNGTFRERTKVMRSLNSDIGAAEFCNGMTDLLQLHPATPRNRGIDTCTNGKYTD